MVEAPGTGCGAGYTTGVGAEPVSGWFGAGAPGSNTGVVPSDWVVAEGGVTVFLGDPFFGESLQPRAIVQQQYLIQYSKHRLNRTQ